MQFYFIRHGQSKNNALWDQGGPRGERRADPELTELGHRQAQHLADFLAGNCVPCEPAAEHRDAVDGLQLTHLYCSPMIRCIETASYVARALSLSLVVWEHVHELGGIFLEDQETGQNVGLPGNDRDYIQSRYKDLILPEGWGVGGWWNRPFEEREQRILRAQHFHRELVRRHGTGGPHGAEEPRVAVVSHAGFFNYWLKVALDWPYREGIGFRKNNAAITRVDMDVRTSVMYVNRTDYIPGELIS